MKIKESEAGEVELRQVFEEATNKNIKAVIEYTTSTRKIVIDFEKKIKDLENLVFMQNDTIQQLKAQLTNIQMKVYAGGS